MSFGHCRRCPTNGRERGGRSCHFTNRSVCFDTGFALQPFRRASQDHGTRSQIADLNLGSKTQWRNSSRLRWSVREGEPNEESSAANQSGCRAAVRSVGTVPLGESNYQKAGRTPVVQPSILVGPVGDTPHFGSGIHPKRGHMSKRGSVSALRDALLSAPAAPQLPALEARATMSLLLALGSSCVSCRSLHRQPPHDRVAPWAAGNILRITVAQDARCASNGKFGGEDEKRSGARGVVFVT